MSKRVEFSTMDISRQQALSLEKHYAFRVGLASIKAATHALSPVCQFAESKCQTAALTYAHALDATGEACSIFILLKYFDVSLPCPRQTSGLRD